MVAVNEYLRKQFYFRNCMVGRRNPNQMKYRPYFEKSLFRPVLKNDCSYKKSTIVLGGILSFLGFKDTPEESELIMKIKKGILYAQRKQFERAEAMFHEALRLAEKEGDVNGITYIYDMLANLALETDENAKAEKLFVEILQRLLAAGEAEDSNRVVHISLKLAKIFQIEKDFKKAEQGFKFCLETLEQKMQKCEEPDEDTLALWGMGMDWYARFLLDVDRKNEALNCFKKAYEMCVKINGKEHEQTVVLLNDLGTVCSLMGDTETAMNYFEQARDIGSKLPHMKDLAAIYINLGQLYLLREMYDESRNACFTGLKKAQTFNDKVSVSEAKKCIETINKIFGNKVPNVSDSGGLKNIKLVN